MHAQPKDVTHAYNGAALKGGTMFGLPVATTLLIFGFPVFWILYTIGFLIVSRHWADEADES
jgi:hypothetical protein